MDMEIQDYWPQDEIFFIANCALFPKRVTNSQLAINQESIDMFGYDEKQKILDEYKSKKMLEFEVISDSNGEKKYLISNIDQSKFKTKLTEYVEKFRNDELITSPYKKPAIFIELQGLFNQYLLHTKRTNPIINPYNIWPNWNNFGNIFPFWEIILSSAILSHDIKIKKIGHYPTIRNVNSDLYVPFAEVEIINPEIFQQTLGSKNTSQTGYNAKIGMNGRIPYIELNGVCRALINRNLRKDNNQYIFMNYLVGHTNQVITRNDLPELSGKPDLAVLAKECGFTKKMKNEFFETLSNNMACLKSGHEISNEMANYITNRYTTIIS